MSFKENFTKIKDQLKAMLNEENTASLTEIDKNLDELFSEHDKLVEKHGELQTAYIDAVKTTSFKTPPDDDTPSQNKSFDEIMKDELQNILNARRTKND